MQLELEHFKIDGAYGWKQDWFPSFFMRVGGCAAVTACDSCIYFALRFGKTNWIPFDPAEISRRNYLLLSERMKPFLHPRMRGIDRLDIYQHGLGAYFRSIGVRGPDIDCVQGGSPYDVAAQKLQEQIKARYPVPFLTLMHSNPDFDFYQWHWYLLMGFQETPETLMVKAVTYGAWRWLDFRKLWDTGKREKGGMVLFSLP